MQRRKSTMANPYKSTISSNPALYALLASGFTSNTKINPKTKTEKERKVSKSEKGGEIGGGNQRILVRKLGIEINRASKIFTNQRGRDPAIWPQRRLILQNRGRNFRITLGLGHHIGFWRASQEMHTNEETFPVITIINFGKRNSFLFPFAYYSLHLI